MAGFWDSATQSLPLGVQLGTRSAEREADREEREKWRAEQNARLDKQDKREEDVHNVRMKQAKKEEDFENLQKQVQGLDLILQSGDEPGFLAGVQRAYTNIWPNGKSGKFYRQQDLPEGHPLTEKWKNDKLLKDNSIVFVEEDENGKGNVIPFKDSKSIMKLLSDGVKKPEAYFAEREKREAIAEAETLKSQQNPTRDKEGKQFYQKFSVGKGGKIESEWLPYTGIEKESGLQQKVRETETVLGSIRKDDKRKMAGLESESEIALRNSKVAKARAEARGAGAGGGEKKADLTKKQLDAAKASLDMLLRPFVKKGKSILDPETGEMTDAADNALNEAGKLIDKAKEDSSSLTQEERRNLSHAIRAHEVFKSYSAAITASVISEEQAARMAAGDGTPTANYKDGSWHIIPTGKDQGKEARWNGSKYEIRERERGGVSASWDESKSEEPTQPAPVATVPRSEPTATRTNATRSGLVAGSIGMNREKSSLENLTIDDLADVGRTVLGAISAPYNRVKEDYEEQKRRSGR